MADAATETVSMGAVAPAAADPWTDPRAHALQLFEAHGASLVRFCRSALGSVSDAEDVVQDTFLKLLAHLRAAGDQSNLRAWLFTVAANGCRDRVRARRRLLPWRADLDAREAAPPDPEPDRASAQAAFRRLAPRDRVLLSLRAQGLSYREIAAAARIAPPSVGRLLARAVDRWKRAVR